MTAAGQPPERQPIAVLRHRVEPLIRASGRLLVVSDFDGTLSPISLDPGADTTDRAWIVPSAERALRRLVALDRSRPGGVRVVILSGRSCLGVASRVRIGGVLYLGNHGLESGWLARRRRAERMIVEMQPGFEVHAARTERLARAIYRRLGRPAWLFVEEKGPSVAFHWRGAPDEDAAGVSVGAAVTEELSGDGGHGFERLEGRRILELRPTDAGAKGSTMRRLLESERPAAVLMLGDDRSDAEAFGVVAEARAGGRVGASLAAAVHSAHETPAEIVATADLLLGSPHEAGRLLAALASALAGEMTQA